MGGFTQKEQEASILCWVSHPHCLQEPERMPCPIIAEAFMLIWGCKAGMLRWDFFHRRLENPAHRCHRVSPYNYYIISYCQFMVFDWPLLWSSVFLNEGNLMIKKLSNMNFNSYVSMTDFGGMSLGQIIHGLVFSEEWCENCSPYVICSRTSSYCIIQCFYSV